MAKRYELTMFDLPVIMRHDYETAGVKEKINSYRRRSVDEFVEFLTNVPGSDKFTRFLDVGAGDTADMDYFKRRCPWYTDVKGCDTYLDSSDYTADLIEQDWYSMAEGVAGITKFDAIYINHSMEHAANIYQLMNQVSKMQNKGGALFVAVPDGNAPFGYAITSSTTHFSVITEGFLSTTLQRFGYNVQIETREFRPGAKEIWAFGIKQFDGLGQ